MLRSTPPTSSLMEREGRVSGLVQAHGVAETVERTGRVIEDGIAAGLHAGAQLAVVTDGNSVVDGGRGDAAPGVAMTVDTPMPRLSATKIITAIAVAQQWERGEFDLDERV